MAAGDVFPLTPHYVFKDTLTFRTLRTEFESGKDQVRALWASPKRMFRVMFKNETVANFDTLWDFYIARQGGYDLFWFKNPVDKDVTAESIGTGDASTTEFDLDVYPVDTTSSTFEMRVDGTPVSATLSNDNVNEVSKVTFASPPGGSTALTGDYEFYYKVRFKQDELTRETMSAVATSGQLELVEVV